MMSEQATVQTQTVARSTFTTIASAVLQRQCACGQHTSAGSECEECKKKREGTLQRAGISPSPVHEVPPIVHEVLRSPGQPLDAVTRAFMEPRFGHDFSGVRVHTDAKAAESARVVNALAYTVGWDVVFGAGQYMPGNRTSRRLLVHELTHVVQQKDATLQGNLTVGAADDDYEREANKIADVVNNDQAQSNSPYLARQGSAHLQRTCGPTAIGTPAGCTPVSGDTLGERFLFAVNCDDFLRPAEQTRLELFADTIANGERIEIHGYASIDGDPTFNENLSCARALKAQAIIQFILTGKGVAASVSVFMHGANPGSSPAEQRSVVINRSGVVPPSPTAGPLCPTVPASTPGTCAARNRGYCDAASCFPGNPWLACACGASADVCRAVDAFSFASAEGLALEACVTAPPARPTGPVTAKAAWLLSTNRCIWGHWRAALDAIHDPTRPIPSSLTPEWAFAVTTCRITGIGSRDCCRAHVVAEQTAIDRCGPYDSSRFGPLPTDVPGAPLCGSIVRGLSPGLPFAGDFGNAADRIAYGISRCC